MKNLHNLIHKPKYVAIVSLIIALIIGILGYQYLTYIPPYAFVAVQAGEIKNQTNNANGVQNINLNFQTSGQVQTINVKQGQSVKSGQILATLKPENTLGALTQAQAGYQAALANYNKLLNGATDNDVAVTNASLQSAQTNLAHAKDSLVLALNNSFTASANAVASTDILFDNPYTNTVAFSQYSVFNNQTFETKIENERMATNATILAWKGELANLDSNNPNLDVIATKSQENIQAISNYFFDLNTLYAQAAVGDQTVIKNIQTNILSAQTAVTNQKNSVTAAIQQVSSANSAISQASANLNLKTTKARPEDIAAARAQMQSALGSMQIAQAAYDAKTLKSPGNGIITSVFITIGQSVGNTLAAMNFTGRTDTKQVAMLVPNSSILKDADKTFVKVKSGNSVENREVSVGASDETNTEIVSGLQIGEEVVVN